MIRAVLLLLFGAVLVLALASGCAPDLRVPEKVSVPVPVACVAPEDVPARPALRTEADLMAMDRYRRTIAAWSDLRKLEAYAAELEAIAAGCARIPAQ